MTEILYHPRDEWGALDFKPRNTTPISYAALVKKLAEQRGEDMDAVRERMKAREAARQGGISEEEMKRRIERMEKRLGGRDRN